MRISINQPAFLPWLGYFHRIAISDFHIVLDHVQFEKNSYTNRNKINSTNGSIWLTVPLITSGRFGNLFINEVEIANISRWQKKITETIKQFYKKSPFFNDYFPFIEETFLGRDWIRLNDLMKHLNAYFLKTLDINTTIVYSSEIEVKGTKSDLIHRLCKQFGCTTYISGPFGRSYLEKEKFEIDNIKVEYHEYAHPVYFQGDQEFRSNLSIIDLLFYNGKASKDILMQTTLE